MVNESFRPRELVKPTTVFNMEYHYQDICMPTDHMLADPYTTDYSNAYAMPEQTDAEYGVRSTVVVDGGDRFGVTAVVFDKHEELVWMGNQGGHVTSYYGPSMQKYTSFQVHETDEIRDIITDEHGIYALTKTSLRHQIRRGIPKYTHRSLNMTDMQCLFQASPTKLLMGGHQEKILELDLNKMTETVFPLPDEHCCVVLRSGGGSIVACGSANGTVTLRDLRSPNTAELTFHAHTACLSDLDMQGNLLITCGFAYSSSGTAEAEPYVVTWDVRRLRGGASDGGAWTSGTHSPPLLLHFVPAFSGRAVAVSGDGHVALLHVNVGNDAENQSVFQVDTQSSTCSVMDVAASSQAFVFGDNGGRLHLFSPRHNHDPVFNNFSRETEFADAHPNIPFSSLTDTNFQLSSVPLPPLTTGDKWFNVLPEWFFKKVYRKPKPIDPEVLKTMKMQGPIGYAPNPKTYRRNQMPYNEDTLEDLKSPRHSEVKNVTQPIPKHYQKMDPRFKHTEIDYESSNHTGLPGLDGAMTNSYCNPMLQVLYYTAPLKATLLAHTCAKEFCLSCELGFLFRMLSTSGGASCQAANFLRAFRTVPEAAALGLVLPDRRSKPDDKLDMVLLIQSWNRFILHQMHYEILETRKKEKELARLNNANSPPKTRAGNVASNAATSHELDRKFDEYNFYNELEFLGPSQFDSPEEKEDWPANNGRADGAPTIEVHPRETDEIQNSQHDQEESEISELFAIRRHQLNRCLKCNKEESRNSVVLACALQQPASPPRSLVCQLRGSLAARRSSPAWCDACARFTKQRLSELLTRLPPILAINCGRSAALEACWSKGTNKDTSEAAKRSISKPCRWGVFCQRAGCRYKHPEEDDADNPYTAKPSSPKSPTAESDCVLPVELVIRLTSEGDIVINDEAEPQTDANQSPSKSDNNSRHKKHSFTETQEEYTLTAAVVCVEDNPKNLVAYVNTPGSDGEPQWYLFNDLCIVPVPVEEVVQCNASWKTPCVLFYTSRNIAAQTDAS